MTRRDFLGATAGLLVLEAGAAGAAARPPAVHRRLAGGASPAVVFVDHDGWVMPALDRDALIGVARTCPGRPPLKRTTQVPILR